MDFWFCETCGKRLTAKDIEEGSARNKKLNGVFCQNCSVGVMTMEMSPITPEQLEKPRQATPPPGTRTRTRQTPNSNVVVGRNSGANNILHGAEVSRSAHGKTPAIAKQNSFPMLLTAIGCVAVVALVAVALGKHKPDNHASDVPHATPVATKAIALSPPAPSAPSASPLTPLTPSAPTSPPLAAPQEDSPALDVSAPPVFEANVDGLKTLQRPEQLVQTAAPVASVEPTAPDHPIETLSAKPSIESNAPATSPAGKAREQFCAILKELAPILRQNRFSAAQELLDARRRDAAFADAGELIDREKSDLAGVLTMRTRAMAALRAKAGTVVTLKKGSMTGTVKAEPNKDCVTLVLKDGPELTVSIEQLDAEEVNALAPAENGVEKAEDLRVRALLFLAGSDCTRAKALFKDAAAAGLHDPGAAYQAWIELAELDELETRAQKLWDQAENHFKNKQWAAAQSAYDALSSQCVRSKVLAAHAETLKERIQAIDVAYRGRMEWNQWRGPHRDGTSTETGWTVKWPKEGPPKLWTTKIGNGQSGIAVSLGRIVTHASAGDRNHEGKAWHSEEVLCLDAQTGKVLWKYLLPFTESAQSLHAVALCTPAIEGKRVYTMSSVGYLTAIDLDTGLPVWGKDVVKDLGAPVPNDNDVSRTPSPLLEGNCVIVNPGIALDKATGNVVWKVEPFSGNSCASPVPCTLNGQRTLIFTNLHGGMAGVNAANGQELWHSKADLTWDYSDPVVFGNHMLVRGDQNFRIDAARVFPVKNEYRFYAPSVTPIVWQNHLYGMNFKGKVFDDESSYALTCLDLNTWTESWSVPAMPCTQIVVDGKLIVLTIEGLLIAAEASPNGYKELARFQAVPAFGKGGLNYYGPTWPAPVLSGGRLYVRGSNGLVCFDVSGR